LLLYYITDRTQFPGDENTRRRMLLRKIAEAARCGVDFIQLREKDLSTRELETLAREVMKVIREASQSGNPRARLLINSRTDIAMACGADGVHLRSDDVSAREIRAIWRGEASPVVSVACHSVAEVVRAAAEGADFALAAPVFEKKDVANARALGLDGLRETCGKKIPVLALGGITRENARMCVEAGAAGIAAIRMFQENDIGEVVRRVRE
jgi:thiamine-phosphate pyrophosphorylase